MVTAKFEQIKQYICQQVESGQWQENAKVPSENSLSDQFVCSRMTARRAITELCDIGLLVRSQGRGTFVATLKSQSSLLEIKNIADEIRTRGHQYNVEVLDIKSIVASEDVAITLGMNVGDTVFYSSLLHHENNQPMQLELRYVNPALVSNYLENDFTQLTPHEFLSMAAPLTEAEHIIEAMMPDNELVKLLQLSFNEPCLEIKRRTFSSKGAVSFARLIHPSSRFRVGGRFSVSN
ncbi:histidine utilization repressor [Psychrobium sp. 1_MG-2023]|uniref:histidine utilization repressor n=1 Tax=Psychrobium sp. 1_MG-2023 TaxID=3062624 RepID=UPI000C33554A|nr:histidine utilization repressor [Psychrobium sp. 1_MG-2023]MDP2561074.1 histidine utilization repressor [Psychrobium sp. 1_MG-2023]PKF58364.1 histidine utilization repressor [Alteromonadales bacterium alter-6D02]